MIIFKKIALILLIVFFVIQFIQPVRNKSVQVVNADVTKGVSVPENVQIILQASRYDCHSNNANYPWYTYLPLYIIASLGFTLQKQYCTVSHVDHGLSHCISKIRDKCVSEHINKKDKNCCRNENKFVKNDNDQNIPESVFHPTPSTAVALPPYFLELSFNEFASTLEVIPINHAPPPDGGLAIYLRDRVFRI